MACSVSRIGGQGQQAGIEDVHRRFAHDRGLRGDVVRSDDYGRGLIGKMEFELDAAQAHVMAIGQHGFFSFLAIDERAVAAFVIADVPLAAVEGDLGVDTRAERVGDEDLAIVAAAHARGMMAIEQIMLAGSAADGHREVGVFLGGGDGHVQFR